MSNLALKMELENKFLALSSEMSRIAGDINIYRIINEYKYIYGDELEAALILLEFELMMVTKERLIVESGLKILKGDS